MQKKNKWHRKCIKIPVYKTDIIVTLTNDADKVNKIHGTEEVEIYGQYITDTGLGHQHYIYLNLWHDKYEISEGVIAHECLHAVMEICKYKGVIVDVDNPEPITYLLEYVVDKVHDFIELRK